MLSDFANYKVLNAHSPSCKTNDFAVSLGDVAYADMPNETFDR
jgi:hypothetical protein